MTGSKPTGLKSPGISRGDVGADSLAGLVELFSIAVPDSAPLRFTTAATASGHVYFDGQRYGGYPLAAKGFSWSVEGPPARPVLELSNILGLFDHAVTSDVLRGCMVQRILTLKNELGPPHGDDGGNCFPPESWVIERIARLDDRLVRIELAAAASLENRTFPERVMLRNLCQHRYRNWDQAQQRFTYKGVTCPYVGDRYFSQTGDPVTDPAADRCALTLDDGCKKRFADTLPFLGFPGVTRQ